MCIRDRGGRGRTVGSAAHGAKSTGPGSQRVCRGAHLTSLTTLTSRPSLGCRARQRASAHPTPGVCRLLRQCGGRSTRPGTVSYTHLDVYKRQGPPAQKSSAGVMNSGRPGAARPDIVGECDEFRYAAGGTSRATQPPHRPAGRPDLPRQSRRSPAGARTVTGLGPAVSGGRTRGIPPGSGCSPRVR